MLPKLQTWIDKQVFPQRVLLSGAGDNLAVALDIAAQLQGSSVDTINSNLHPDTVVFRDVGKSFKTKYSEQAKKDEQAENENAEGIIDWATKKPVSPYRIVVLENLERANREATNKLLKLIEEPPHKTIFILTTHNYHRLLDTIISRVTVVRLEEKVQDFVPDEDIIGFLSGTDLLKNFKRIEALDKATKNNPQKKINRQVVLDFLQQCLTHARHLPEFRNQLELLLETHQAIGQNLNVRFTLERMCVNFTSPPDQKI